jgi:hypothetical protein
MDCVNVDGRRYFYKREDIKDNTKWHYPLKNHLNAWRPALGKCPNSERIKAVSGPVMDIFGQWDGAR